MTKLYAIGLVLVSLSSCQFITGEITLNESLLNKSAKVFAYSGSDIESILSDFANEVFPNKHNLYCYTTPKNLNRYVLLQQVEKSGLLETYKTGEIITYRDNLGEVKAISIVGDFDIPTFFNDATTVGNLRDRIIKKIVHNGHSYYMSAFPNQSDYGSGCSDTYLDEENILKTRVILYKEAELAEILYNQFAKTGGNWDLIYLFGR